jgi:hypothetical protein
LRSCAGAGRWLKRGRVGSHWAQDVQVDVVALNWREQAILLGECKWGVDAVGRAVVRELIEEKTPKVLQALPDSGREWTVHHALFARTDFTKAAQAEAQTRKAILVDLTALDREAFEADKGP